MERVKLLKKPKLSAHPRKVQLGDIRGKYDTKSPEVRAERRAKDVRRGTLWVQRAQDRAAGRPSKYMAAVHDELIFDLRLAGLSIRQLAAALNISEATLEEWKQQHPSFFAHWLRGGDEADALVTRALFEKAIGYSHESEKLFYDAKAGEVVRADIVEHFPPDASAAQYWLNNRQQAQWKSRQSTELTGPDGQPLQMPEIVIQPVRAVKRGEQA